jgi:hypothetical protein
VICLTSTRRDEVTSFVYVLVPARSLEYGDLAHLPSEFIVLESMGDMCDRLKLLSEGSQLTGVVGK